MTATLGLERLPRPIATLLDEAAANLLAIATELDALVHGDASSPDAIARGEDNGDRIVHDLIEAARDSWRLGPERAVDDVVDALDALARACPHPPPHELADLFLALRDAARDAGHALTAVEHQDELRAWLSRCRDRELEAQRLSRLAPRWLLVDQPDLQLAIRGHTVLRQADAALHACTRLRARLGCHALA